MLLNELRDKRPLRSPLQIENPFVEIRIPSWHGGCIDGLLKMGLAPFLAKKFSKGARVTEELTAASKKLEDENRYRTKHYQP